MYIVFFWCAYKHFLFNFSTSVISLLTRWSIPCNVLSEAYGFTKIAKSGSKSLKSHKIIKSSKSKSLIKSSNFLCEWEALSWPVVDSLDGLMLIVLDRLRLKGKTLYLRHKVCILACLLEIFKVLLVCLNLRQKMLLIFA